MDQGFGIDIDKVLDDFEKSEGNSNHFHSEPIHTGPYWISNNHTGDLPILQNRSTSYYPSSHSSSNYAGLSLLNESAEKINLADADFSASSTSLNVSVSVPMTLPPITTTCDNHLSYNQFVVPQTEKWLQDALPGFESSIISNGFGHEEEEEVLAVQVMTSLDQETNFEIKLLPSDQASTSAFENSYLNNDSKQVAPPTDESLPEQDEDLKSIENDTRQPEESASNVPALSLGNSDLESFVDAGLPNDPDISPDSSYAFECANLQSELLNNCAIPNEEPSVYDAEPDLGFEEADLSESSDEGKESTEKQMVANVVVGFDNQVDEIDCDELDNYLSDLNMADSSTDISCVNNDLVNQNDNESTNSSVLGNQTESSQVMNSFNTGARPKVRDFGYVKDTNLKVEVAKSTETAKENLHKDENSPSKEVISSEFLEKDFSSVLVKSVESVQMDTIDFSEVSPNQSITKTKTEVQCEDISELKPYQSTALVSSLECTLTPANDASTSLLGGKKPRPTSLNLSGRLTVRPTSTESSSVAPVESEELHQNSVPTTVSSSTTQNDSVEPVDVPIQVPTNAENVENVEKLVDVDLPELHSRVPLDQAIPSFDMNQDLLDHPDLTEEEQLLGKLRPFWIPDVDAPNCMNCELKFTLIKRRHHCRACGKVYCSQCCSSRAKLACLDYKEGRVCHPCLTILNKVLAIEHFYSPNANGPSTPTAPQSEDTDPEDSPALGGPLLYAPNTPSPSGNSMSPSPNQSPVHRLLGEQQELLGGPGWHPNPNNPPEYCSKVPPLQQALSQRPPPTVLVPVGVLKRGDKSTSGRREPKQVMFSDGIRPGGDLTDLDVAPEPRLPYRRPSRVQRRVDKGSPVAQSSPSHQHSPSSPPATGNNRRMKLMRARGRMLIHDEAGPLPPLVPSLDFTLEDNPDPQKLFQRLQEETSAPVVFALTKNLSISMKIIKLDCCMGQEVWYFSSSGMASVGQDEVIFLLQRLPDENAIPRDAFSLFTAIYDNATKGTWFNDLGHLLFPEGLLGAREHAGVLFIRPSHQCQSKLPLPQPPHLVALLIQKWEVPWAKVFPLRLLLRIGAEFRYYPCPLVSVRFRKPVYGEIGHTIMDVLADFRNYQYTLPVVPGVTVCMEDKKTTVNFPRNRYDHIIKLLNSSNEHVLGLGASFSLQADSHLVCMQNEDSSYQTQAINIQNTPHKVTGASFIVFSGALKSSSGLTGKSSIVEDGLLVQITQDSMGALKTAIRDMKDYLVSCGQVDSPSTQEQVLLKWTQDDRAFNIGVKSPIDGRSLEGVESIRIQMGTDYATDRFLVRWTEVFFLTSEPASTGCRPDPTDPCKLSEAVSQACCLALTPRLDCLMESGLTRIGLRVTMDAENVGYEIGSRGEPLEGSHMVDLDSALIPLIMGGGSPEAPLILELIFHVLHK